MSRVGKLPIEVPAGVKISVGPRRVQVEGPRGKMETPVPEGIQIKLEDSVLTASCQREEKKLRALHGLTRALLANAVTGVSTGFSKELDVVGIGYKAEMRGKYLNLSLGYSHPIEFAPPKGIELGVERAQRQVSNYVATITVSGFDKGQVGQVAADIRALRKPDPYKGKGVRYADEVVRLKVGKKGA